MNIQFACPSCKSIFRIDDSLAGKKGKCEKCGTIMEVPAPMHNDIQQNPSPSQPTTKSSDKVWFFLFKDRQFGPLTETELHASFLTFEKTELIWKEGMEVWVPYSSIFQEAPECAQSSSVSPTQSEPTTSEKVWFFVYKSRQVGPLTETELHEEFSKWAFEKTELVRKGCMGGWKPYSSFFPSDVSERAEFSPVKAHQPVTIASDKVWFIDYNRKGGQIGPLTETDLHTVFLTLDKRELIWKEDMDEWKPYHTIFQSYEREKARILSGHSGEYSDQRRSISNELPIQESKPLKQVPIKINRNTNASPFSVLGEIGMGFLGLIYYGGLTIIGLVVILGVGFLVFGNVKKGISRGGSDAAGGIRARSEQYRPLAEFLVQSFTKDLVDGLPGARRHQYRIEGKLDDFEVVTESESRLTLNVGGSYKATSSEGLSDAKLFKWLQFDFVSREEVDVLRKLREEIKLVKKATFEKRMDQWILIYYD